MRGLSLPRLSRVAIALIGALVLGASAAGIARADRGGFVIKEYHSDLWVEENADLLVEERIVVDFSQSRHGIYRNVPVRYTDPRGFAYSIGFRMLDVRDDRGKKHQTKVTNEGNDVVIRIGDPDRTVTGLQTYIIRYRVQGAVTQATDFDELYWNSVGDEWLTSIESASATVHLPASVEPDQIVSRAWSGYFQSTESDVDIEAASADQIDFRLTRSLGANEGMTVRVAWPQGHVDYPSPLEKWLRLFGDNWIILSPLAALTWLSRRFRREGRDHPDGDISVTVRYEAPEGVVPGEIGTIIDEKVDLVDITATVVDLAVRGYLTIGLEDEKTFLGSREVTTFKRKAKDSRNLMQHERLALDALFATGSSVTSDDLKEKYYQHLPNIKTAVYEKMTLDGYFNGNPENVRNRYYLSGFGYALLVFGVGMAWGWWRGTLMPYALVAPGIGAVLTMIAFFVFAGAMPSKSKKGVELKTWAVGFQEFVDRVESDRLERNEAKNVFETLLPFAMALGVAGTWAQKFEGIYEEAGPSWYAGPHYHGRFSTRAFENNLSSAMAATATTMAQAPRSSGSGGGGGFSGGGFGGGGGGSW